MAATDESLIYEAVLEQDGVKVSKSPWGPDDEIGRLNWITPETNRAILEHLDGSHVFDLNVEYFIGHAVLGRRGRPEVRDLDDAHAAGLDQRQPLGRRPEGAREVQLLRRLDPHVHALRDARRHAQPPRLLREVLERLDGGQASRQPRSGTRAARRSTRRSSRAACSSTSPACTASTASPTPTRSRPTTSRRPPQSRASSCARRTSCSSARAG